MLGLAFAKRVVNLWTDELTIDRRGVTLNFSAVSRSLGKIIKASRNVDTTLTVIVDL